ncbi:hypothetical protein QBC43DRAFT_311888 [Cladorrhinum sp. PSN259]|nr:hypothetical protein QBC43DRAFT_311888 [Cladorrhinum sp. PSN259]
MIGRFLLILCFWFLRLCVSGFFFWFLDYFLFLDKEGGGKEKKGTYWYMRPHHLCGSHPPNATAGDFLLAACRSRTGWAGRALLSPHAG